MYTDVYIYTDAGTTLQTPSKQKSPHMENVWSMIKLLTVYIKCRHIHCTGEALSPTDLALGDFGSKLGPSIMKRDCNTYHYPGKRSKPTIQHMVSTEYTSFSHFCLVNKILSRPLVCVCADIYRDRQTCIHIPRESHHLQAECRFFMKIILSVVIVYIHLYVYMCVFFPGSLCHFWHASF